MNNHQQQTPLGDQFKDAVQDAIYTGDFKKLNILVTDTVTDAIAEAGSQLKKTASDIIQEDKKEFHKNSHQDIHKNVKEYQEWQRQRNQFYEQTKKHSTAVPSSPKKKMLPAAQTKNIGQLSGILYTVFGGLGMTAMGGAFLFTILLTLISGTWTAPVLAFFGIGAGAFGIMLRKGISQTKRLSRMKRYISLCGDNMYVNLQDLADQTQKSMDYVLKDIKKMLSLGFFPQGHLDQKESCLMLDDATYREYLRIEKERKVLAEEQAKKADATPEEKAADELNAILSEGQDYIQKLHHLNDIIEDPVVSEKLYQMEHLLKEIFGRLKETPEQMPKMRKLMNYYLPTTIKLLQAYSEFDDVSAPNQDIASAKSEIEKTIDIINEAFTELLNKLFQKSAFDAATDAQVLQTMLAKEGLTKTKIMEEI